MELKVKNTKHIGPVVSRTASTRRMAMFAGHFYTGK